MKDTQKKKTTLSKKCQRCLNTKLYLDPNDCEECPDGGGREDLRKTLDASPDWMGADEAVR